MQASKWIWMGAVIQCFAATAVATSANFAEHPSAQAFIANMAQQHQFDRDKLHQLFTQINSSPEIIKRITQPFEKVSWNKYKKHFVNSKRINSGVAFWGKHATTLQQATQQYGIPAEIIVAILGVESSYGQYLGKYPVLEALATLAFDYPPRAKFFKSELEHFLLLAREQKLDPMQVKGSYAGAIGSPQFIASSIRHYAVDFDQSGQIDLANNIKQAIGSVANYFHKHGWVRDQPIITQAQVETERYAKLQLKDNKNPKPGYLLRDLAKYGVTPRTANLAPDNKVAVLEFEEPSGKQVWLGHKNFFVITRYNHSSQYAMAIVALSKMLRERRVGQLAAR